MASVADSGAGAERIDLPFAERMFALTDLAIDIAPAAENRPVRSDRINHETPAKWVRKA